MSHHFEHVACVPFDHGEDRAVRGRAVGADPVCSYRQPGLFVELTGEEKEGEGRARGKGTQQPGLAMLRCKSIRLTYRTCWGIRLSLY